MNPLLSPDAIPDLERGLCREVDGDLFFPATGTGNIRAKEAQVDAARAICRRCPERLACLTWALENDERWGIWGGLTEGEREAVKR